MAVRLKVDAQVERSGHGMQVLDACLGELDIQTKATPHELG